MKILILCTGNSCRSQMAQGFLESFDRRITVCSAGTKPARQVNQTAVKVMREVGIDIGKNVPKLVDDYLNENWDYVITVCDNAKETCPVFPGKVKSRMHIGFEDPSEAVGSPEFIHSEFCRVRDEIKARFYELYLNEIKLQL